MDKAGRRPLLLYPMLAMNVILILITVSLNLQVSTRNKLANIVQTTFSIAFFT